MCLFFFTKSIAIVVCGAISLCLGDDDLGSVELMFTAPGAPGSTGKSHKISPIYTIYKVLQGCQRVRL